MLSEQRIEKQNAAFFTGFYFALSLPCIFSCLPRSSRLSLPLCLHSLSVCLSFTLSSCRVHTVLCVLFLNEDFFSCRQPLSSAAARPHLADCGSVVVTLIRGEVLELAPKRERITEQKMTGEKESATAQPRLLSLHVCRGSNSREIGFSCFSLLRVFRGFLRHHFIAFKICFSAILIDTLHLIVSKCSVVKVSVNQ